MPKFEISDLKRKTRSHCGTQIYMASHPVLRSFMRGVHRPKHFGDRVWGASLKLVEQLEFVSAKKVLDIGCGWGLVGVHLARTKEAEVTCTDLDDCLGQIVQAHAELNEVSIKFRAVSFKDLIKTDLAYDLVIGSDICFSDEVVAELILLIDHAYACGTSKVMIADIGRPDFTDLVEHSKKKYITKLEKIDDVNNPKPCFILTIDFNASRGQN